MTLRDSARHATSLRVLQDKIVRGSTDGASTRRESHQSGCRIDNRKPVNIVASLRSSARIFEIRSPRNAPQAVHTTMAIEHDLEGTSCPELENNVASAKCAVFPRYPE